MKGHFIDLMDGTRLVIKVNFGTIYYMQKQKGYYRLAKKAEKNPESLTEQESFDMAANIIYAMIRSNGRSVTFDEALALVPPDTKDIGRVLKAFRKEYEAYSKKKQAKASVAP